jgi:hypothetical protein
VIWADDNPQSIADAVSELIARNLDPVAIRNSTLRKVNSHREVFINLLSDLMSRDGSVSSSLVSSGWDKFFCNKLLKNHSPQEIGLIKARSRLKSFAGRLGL